MVDADKLSIAVPDAGEVSALALAPDSPRFAYVFAHGAGAGMTHAFMAALAQALARRGVATLRFQFPYMERGTKRTDSPGVAQAAVRAAVEQARRRWPVLPLFAGGKSFGGRMSSQAQAEEPLPGVRGLAFVGFPLHPAGKPGTARAAHLATVRCPMLFLQGTRDELAGLALLRQVLEPLGPQVSLHVEPDADHAFHVRKSSGRDDQQVIESLADAMLAWFVRSAGAAGCAGVGARFGPSTGRRSRLRSHRLRMRLCILAPIARLDRQHHPERRPFPDHAGHLDASAVLLDDAVGQ
jgi:predicted alpha/beta-hydrolase family hydrolase